MADADANKTLGQINYEGYNEITEYKNFRGEDVPQFPDLPDKISKAWEVGAERVETRVLANTRPSAPLPDGDPIAIERLFKSLVVHLASYVKNNPSVGREAAVSKTSVETAELWFEKAERFKLPTR